MAATLRNAMAGRRNVPAELVTNLTVSYRIGPGNTLVRMTAAAESATSTV
jgi:hypothetical protein